jgi:large subunit ribosomal protein L15
VLNLDRLAEMGETNLTYERLRELGFLKRRNELLKILGNGELTQAITVHAHKFSKSAQEKIEKAGGTVVLLGAPVAAAEGAA